MSKANKTIATAAKANDWKCTGGVNAGSDSYRVYESTSANQKVVQDGKNTNADLKRLKGE